MSLGVEMGWGGPELGVSYFLHHRFDTADFPNAENFEKHAMGGEGDDIVLRTFVEQFRCF